MQQWEAGEEERKQTTLFSAPFRGTVYLGQLSPKAEYLCSLFNSLSCIIEKNAKALKEPGLILISSMLFK